MITRLLAATCGVAALLGSLPVQAERLKEVASIQGVLATSFRRSA